MALRWGRIIVGTLLLCVAPLADLAEAQQYKKDELKPTQVSRKPVVEYIVTVVLLSVPLFLVCRSSRRF